MKRDVTKSKRLQDILSMLHHLIAQNGDTMHIPLIPVEQQDGRTLYTGSLTSDLLQSLICRLPRNLENPEGIQRALISKKVEEIADRLSAGGYGLPGAVVIALKYHDGPYITIAPIEIQEGLSVSVLQVDLAGYQQHLAACETDENGYLAEPEKELLGFMIDGHHRTEGAYAAGMHDYAFPTSIYVDMELQRMAEAFAGINCYQEKPSAIHTNAMRRLSGLMTEQENDAFEIMTQLNDGEGLFHDRIKMFDGVRAKGQPRAFLNASKMQTLLEKWLDANQAEGFHYRGLHEYAEAIEQYFDAWRTCYPSAWDDSHFVLTKTMGIDILFDLYGPLCQFMRIETLPSRTKPKTEDFVQTIHRCFFKLEDDGGRAHYTPKRLLIDELAGDAIPLNWESTAFGALSSGKGISLLKRQLRREIGCSHE